LNGYGLPIFAQSSKMGTEVKRFDTSLANRSFLVFDFRAARIREIL